MTRRRKEQHPHRISTDWWDLAKTAKQLDVPVSSVILAMELLKTNRRDVVMNHVKEYTLKVDGTNLAVEIPKVQGQQQSLEEIRNVSRQQATTANRIIEVTEEIEGISKWFRRPVRFRIVLNANYAWPQYIHALTGMQSHDKCTVKVIQ